MLVMEIVIACITNCEPDTPNPLENIICKMTHSERIIKLICPHSRILGIESLVSDPSLTLSFRYGTSCSSRTELP
jgi:hypothetical protein